MPALANEPAQPSATSPPWAVPLVVDCHYSSRHYVADLWRFRRVVPVLAWMGMLSRYRYAAIGLLWVVVKAAVTFFFFWLLFSRVLKVNAAAGLNEGAIIVSGVLVWQLFQSVIAESSMAILNALPLVRTAYIPRILKPMGATLMCLVEFLAVAAFFLLMGPLLGVHYGPQLLWLPVAIALSVLVMFAMGMGLALSVVRFYDVRFLVTFFMQTIFFVTPVAYAVNLIPEPWRIWYSLNPLVGCIELFRLALCTSAYTIYWPAVMLSATMGVGLLVVGALAYIRYDGVLADVI
ncbi:MAG: ABC transporter permease [Cyanobacteria bacterium HKST-UBA06]|nr:ABC transporter permease [Cyanobacteria bacterium HKST-UBA05]MCA9807979.1 ABC transporter permease [Cyanobacteria bacterium HKST-UBA06]